MRHVPGSAFSDRDMRVCNVHAGALYAAAGHERGGVSQRAAHVCLTFCGKT